MQNRSSRRAHRARRTRRVHHRGGVTPMPLAYYDPLSPKAGSSDAGTDRLSSVTSTMIRPRIGGGRRKTHHRRIKGGFIPSVMEGFSMAASKYVAPLALMLMYKLLNKGKDTSKGKGNSKGKGKGARKRTKKARRRVSRK